MELLVDTAFAYCPGQLACLLGQPRQRGRLAARRVPLAVRARHEVLEVGQVHGERYSRVTMAPTTTTTSTRMPTDTSIRPAISTARLLREIFGRRDFRRRTRWRALQSAHRSETCLTRSAS